MFDDWADSSLHLFLPAKEANELSVILEASFCMRNYVLRSLIFKNIKQKIGHFRLSTHSSKTQLIFQTGKFYYKLLILLKVSVFLGRLDSRVVFTLDYHEHRYAAPWAERSILGDDHSFSAQA